jgi:hypothetical protein
LKPVSISVSWLPSFVFCFLILLFSNKWLTGLSASRWTLLVSLESYKCWNPSICLPIIRLFCLFSAFSFIFFFLFLSHFLFPSLCCTVSLFSSFLTFSCFYSGAQRK